MPSVWPRVPLGDVLSQNREYIEAPGPEAYPKLSVKLYGKGVVLDAPADGATLKMKRHQLAKAGQVILSEIWGKKGAIGLVPPEGDGALCTSHFFLFDTDMDRVEPGWLRLLFAANYLQDQLSVRAKGTTGYAAVRPGALLAASIPLPPIWEQRRIVARIEELAAKVEEALGLQGEALEAIETLFDRTRARIFEEAVLRGVQPLSEIATLERGKFSHRPRNDTRFFGGNHPWIQIAEIERSGKRIRGWSETLNDAGLAISKKFPKGTVLISIAATIGAVGILDFDCCIPDSIVAVTPGEETDSELLYHYLGYVRTHLESIAPQSAQKNINLRILAGLPVPQMTLPVQRSIIARLDKLQEKVDILKRLRREAQAELVALLPSVLERAFRGEL